MKTLRGRTDRVVDPKTFEVGAGATQEALSVNSNIHKWSQVVAYYRWFPDLWYDLLIPPETKGIRLNLDQRVILRSLVRFRSTYVTLPRGSGKTMLSVMYLIHQAVWYPNCKLSISAQTRESSAKLLKDKYDELCFAFPMLRNEVEITSFKADTTMIRFKNGSVVDNLANHQSTKGARRTRGIMDEDNLTDSKLFEDVLEPVFNVPRRTIGKLGLVDPYERNGSISFLTSAGFRNSDAWHRCLAHYEGMLDINGNYCIGFPWQMNRFFNRGETASTILEKKKKLSSVAFDMNYRAHWTGASDSALVSIARLLNCRTLTAAEEVGDGKHEYVLGVDVARSDNDNNNQSSVAVLKVIKHSNGRVREVDLVNLVTIKGSLDFTAQTIEIKRIKNKYNASVIVFDDNGLGITKVTNPVPAIE